MILHIPHASTAIPEDSLDGYLLSDAELVRELYVILETIDPETTTKEIPVSPEPDINPKPTADRFRVEWSDATLQRELEAAFRKGYLVIPTSRLKEIELCNLAFEPAGRVDLPDCGHVIVRLKNPA